MGDSRASVEITFSIYGKEFHQKWWINWMPSDELYPVDRRIVEWFDTCYATARYGYDSMQAKVAAEEEERRDREQLARLQAKYPEPAT